MIRIVSTLLGGVLLPAVGYVGCVIIAKSKIGELLYYNFEWDFWTWLEIMGCGAIPVAAIGLLIGNWVGKRIERRWE
jgi:hypothetical protein